MTAHDEAVALEIPRYRRVAYAALLFALALGLVEVGMRVSFYLGGDLPPTPDVSLEYEWKWARRHLEAGTAATLDDTLHAYDEDLGWRLVADYDRDGVRTNHRGLRADREYAPGRQPGRRRLALLGDSFTFGAHVADHETFGHFLERDHLSGWEVINFAVSGYGTDQALLAYEESGIDLAPEVVVMGFYVKDYERNQLRFLIYGKPYFEPDGDGLQLMNRPVMPPEALYAEYASGRRRVDAGGRPYLVLSLAKSLRRLRDRRPSESDPEWQVLARLMRRFRDRVREEGAIPVWLVLPKRDVVQEGRSRYAAIEEMCEREARDLGLSFLRMDAAFRAHAAQSPDVPLYRPRAVGGHFSVDGHRLVARTLASHLRTSGVLERSDRD